MAQRKAPPDSARTVPVQKPFVRLDDIGNTGLILGIIIGVLISGSIIVLIVFFESRCFSSRRCSSPRFVTFYFRIHLLDLGKRVTRSCPYALPWGRNWTNIRTTGNAVCLEFTGMFRRIAGLIACWLKGMAVISGIRSRLPTKPTRVYLAGERNRFVPCA